MPPRRPPPRRAALLACRGQPASSSRPPAIFSYCAAAGMQHAGCARLRSLLKHAACRGMQGLLAALESSRIKAPLLGAGVAKVAIF
jgi:hypothetical protein